MSSIAEVTDTTITVVVPIEIRRRNGRPKIVLPEDGPDAGGALTDQARAGVLRAIARAWDWRRQLDAGKVTTLKDIADAERLTLSFLSRFIRLAYLSPVILDRIVSGRAAVAVSLERLAAVAVEPWPSQTQQAFDERI